MTDYRACRLADICESIDYGYTASAKTSPVGPKFLRITDVVGSALDWSAVPYVEGDSATLARYRLNHGDIVIARTGATTGESRFIKSPPDAVFASYLVRLKIADTADARYVAYWLKSTAFREYLHGVLGDKSAQPNASATTMTNAPMQLPVNKGYQSAVASTLAALDDKIECNRRMNVTLEATARAIFKDWFVLFGPTYAKLEKQPQYLDSNMWSLFPDSLDYEGIPKTWRNDVLDVVADLNPEVWSDRSKPDLVEYVDLANTKWGTIDSTVVHSYAEAPSRARRVLRPGDTIVGTVRPGNGSYAYIDRDGLTGSTGFAVLRPRDASCREFVYCSATSVGNIERLSHLADGAAYPAVRPDVVTGTAIVLPPEPVIRAFSATCAPLIARCESNKRENITLAATRDLLLPKLMSGEIRVREADAIVQEVARA